MRSRIAGLLALTLSLAATQGALAGIVSAPLVERVAPDKVVVTWTDQDAVDVYLAEQPNRPLKLAKRVSAGDRNHRFEKVVSPDSRPYFTLRDSITGRSVQVAERLVPLEQGSNFRDIGGYPGFGGKHVRWGLIYRSGASPMLTDADVRRVQGLVSDMVDLRSSEERLLAPTRVFGVNYAAVGYPMTSITNLTSTPTGPLNMGNLYRRFPTLLAPQLKIIFSKLIVNQGALVFNCSAGQDRTGFATAMILSALGVPRDVILSDYHLSTTYRRPQYEMPRLEAATQAANPVAGYFANNQKDPSVSAPRPLYDANHRAFLESAFDEIEAKWGTVDNYLAKEIGIGPAQVARLRAIYLQ